MTHSLPFDLAVVVSFGYFLPQSLLSAFPRGGINVHPSLLPKFRGAAPIQHTILNGDTETGVSIIELHARKFDAGRILNQCKVPVPEGVYYKDLHDVLAARGAALLADTVRNLDQFERLAKTQEETMVMKAPKITKDMARIIWDQWTAEDIYRRYRAFGHQEPLHTTFKDNAVQIKGMMDPKEAEKAYGVPPNGPAEPGTIAFVKPANVLWVRCREGWAACTSFHPEYKKQQSAPNFKNGYRLVSMSDRFV